MNRVLIEGIEFKPGLALEWERRDMVTTWPVRAVSPEGLVTFWVSCAGVLQALADRLAGMVRHQRDRLGRTLRIEA